MNGAPKFPQEWPLLRSSQNAKPSSVHTLQSSQTLEPERGLMDCGKKTTTLMRLRFGNLKLGLGV